VRAFLDYGADFDRSTLPWAGWCECKLILVAWRLRHQNVVRALLEHYRDVNILKLATCAVTARDIGIFEIMAKYDEIQRKASLLPKQCLLYLDSPGCEIENACFPSHQGI
jgi:hypothetical protein